MKKRLLLGVMGLLIATSIFAQKPGIQFTESTYDFGTVAEEVGKVSHVFEFTNTGDADLVLTNVQASCGCTTPQWVREPVAPKQKGTITVTYSAAGRPGPFTKTITVTGNADKQVLVIKGTVTPKGQKTEDVYPFLDGDVRLKSETLSFGDIEAGKTQTAILSIANMAKKDVPVNFVKLPDFITAEAKTLKSEEKGNITLTFNAAKVKEWGAVKKDIYFTTGDAKDSKAVKYKLTVSANIFEKFTDQQIANPPAIGISNEVNAGVVPLGKTGKVKVSVKNTGKSPLIIRKVTSDSPEFEFSAPKSIKPGKSADLKIKIDATKLAAGKYSKNVTLMLNEPNNAHKNITVAFEVK